MMPASAPGPHGSMRGRRAVGAIAAAIALTSAGCGLFSSDDDGSTTATTTTAPAGRDLTDAQEALCASTTALREAEVSLEDLLRGRGDDADALLVSVGLLVGTRDDLVRRLGPYELGLRAVDRRWDRSVDDADRAPGDPPPPAFEWTQPELASVQAADRFLAEERCPAT